MTLFVILVHISKDGSGVATLRGVSIVVNNTNPGDKDKSSTLVFTPKVIHLKAAQMPAPRGCH